ncbi:UPF0147 family protein [Candidatus Woesearchaeota archaeon]|nr:UPF0147 family protein [Candidatus Woesearchaeota archaeon]
MNDEINQVNEIFEDLLDDSSVSKNIKIKINSMKKDLKNSNEQEMSLTANKIIYDLEELSNDVNLPAHIRTQLFLITSTLERL